jgi:hypothetical protein
MEYVNWADVEAEVAERNLVPDRVVNCLPVQKKFKQFGPLPVEVTHNISDKADAVRKKLMRNALYQLSRMGREYTIASLRTTIHGELESVLNSYVMRTTVQAHIPRIAVDESNEVLSFTVHVSPSSSRPDFLKPPDGERAGSRVYETTCPLAFKSRNGDIIPTAVIFAPGEGPGQTHNIIWSCRVETNVVRQTTKCLISGQSPDVVIRFKNDSALPAVINFMLYGSCNPAQTDLVYDEDI